MLRDLGVLALVAPRANIRYAALPASRFVTRGGFLGPAPCVRVVVHRPARIHSAGGVELRGAFGWTVTTYSEAFKSKMVQRMTGPEGRSALSLSGETGVSQSSLSKWLREAKVRPMADANSPKKEKRPEDWTAAEKLAAVMEASGLSDVPQPPGEHIARGMIEDWIGARARSDV